MDRRIEKTRQTIMETFMELLREKGFEKLTIRDIAERANINRGTVYLHYLDKYDLFEKCIEKYLEDLFATCSRGKPIRIQDDAMKSVFLYLEENFDLYQLLLRNDRFGFFHSKLCKTIGEQVELALSVMQEGNEQDLDVPREFLTNGFLGVLEWWLTHSTTCSASEISEQLLQFLKPYLQNFPRQELPEKPLDSKVKPIAK